MLLSFRARTLLCAGLLLLGCSPGIFSQTITLPMFLPEGVVDLHPSNTSRPVPERSALLRLNSAWFDTLSPASVRSALVREFPFPDGTHHTLRLERFDLLAPSALLYEGRLGGDRAVIPDRQLFFKGRVEGVEGSFVYLALFPGFAFGFVEIPDPGSELPQRIMIAPDNLDNPVPTTVVFNEADAPSLGTPPLCGAEDPLALFGQQGAELESIRREAVERKGGGRALQSEQPLVAQIAIECDDDFFRVHSSNLSRSANYALAIMGAASAVYQRDINIALQVPFLRVWTTQVNPFPGPKDGDLLGQVRAHWESSMQGVERTSTVLMTSYRGGVAWVGTMCGSYGYAMMGEGGNFNFPASSYVWDIDVTSHELGHNFGSPHTHSCFWAPAVDSCYDAEGGCFGATNPHPGTIMSYCHLSAGTVLKFHPRVATYIRTAAERYPCVTAPPVSATRDVATLAVLAPATGGSIVRGTVFTPSAIVGNLGLVSQSTVNVTCRVTDTATFEVYSSTRTLSALNAGASARVTFQSTALVDTGIYQVTVTATVANDDAPVNNALSRPFAVVGAAPSSSLQLLSPNGGEAYAADSTVPIRWSSSGADEVTLDLSVDSGLSWRTVRWSVKEDSARYLWSVPPLPTTRALLRVTSISDARVVDQSDRVFTIALDSDAAVTEFIAPHFNDSTTGPFVPRVEVRNNGSQALADLPVRLTLMWRPGDLVLYDTTLTVPSLPAGSVQTVDFPTVGARFPEGNLVMTARTLLPGDRNPANDSLSRTSELVGGISPPSSLLAEGLDAAASLRWAGSTTPGVTGYRIYRGVSPETLQPAGTVRPTVRMVVDDPLVNDRLYYYAVSALKDTLESILSPIAVADPTHQIAGDSLREPVLLLPANGARNIPLPVGLTWRTVPGAELYEVQVAADPACADVISTDLVREPRALPVPLAEYGRSYYWRVRPFNNSGIGPWSPVWSFATGERCGGGALTLSGNESGLLDTGFVWSGGAVTVEFWLYLKAEDVGASSLFGVGYEDDTKHRLQAHVPWSDGTLYWDYGDIGKDGRISIDFRPHLDRWTHVALVSNGRDFKAIYFDGELAASGTKADDPGPLDSLRIGAAAKGVFPAKGTVDEFRLWNRALTAAEIRHTMGRAIDTAPGLVARYHFDEGSGNTASGLAGTVAQILPGSEWSASQAGISCLTVPDLEAPRLTLPTEGGSVPPGAATLFSWSGVAGAGAYEIEIGDDSDFAAPIASSANVPAPWYLYGALDRDRSYRWRVRAVGANGPGAWSMPGRFVTGGACAGASLVLDGAGNSVDIPSFEWGSRAATVELWLLVDSADVRNSWLFYTGPADSATRFSSHAPWSDKQLVFDYGTTSSRGRVQVSYAPYIGRWTHVALVSNGRDFKAVYLNGELVDSVAAASRPRFPRRGLVIGGSRNGTSYFKSRLTEFRIWNVARSGAAIREDMYRRLGGPRSGLVGYWPLDAAPADSVVLDLSGFGNNAVLRNAPMWDVSTPFPGPLPVAIGGPGVVLHDTAGVVYTATEGAGSYEWIVIGGAIVSGQSTRSITVDWGGGPEGLVALVAAPGGCELTAALPVSIYGGTGDVPLDAVGATVSLAVHPNPTDGLLEIPVTLPCAVHASLTIHTIRGVQVGTVADGAFAAGTTLFHYDASPLVPGVYLVELTTPTGRVTRMVTVVR